MKKRPWLRALIGAATAAVLTLGVVSPAHAQSTWQVTGTVTDAQGNQLSGVRVMLQPTTCTGHGEECVSHSATTAADGSYTVTGLGSHAYFGFADAGVSGYVSTWLTRTGEYSSNPYLDGTAIASAGRMDFHLMMGARLSGTVTDRSGRPAAGATISVPDAPYVAPATTASDGSYRIVGIPAGSVTLTAAGSDYIATPSERSVDVVAGQETGGIDLVVDRGALVSGTVYDAAGAPVRSATLVIGDQRCDCDDEGHCALRLAPGTYTAQAFNWPHTPSDARSITVVEGQDIAVSLRLKASARLTVRVTGEVAGQPSPSYSVALSTKEAGVVMRQLGAPGTPLSVELPAETYSVEVEVWSTPARVEQFTVPLQPGDSRELTVSLGEPSRPKVTAHTPRITGKAQVGRRLAAKPGAWGPKPVHFSYQWLRDGRPIAGATKATYRLTKADRGHRIRVRVTGSKRGYTAVVSSSAATPKVRR